MINLEHPRERLAVKYTPLVADFLQSLPPELRTSLIPGPFVPGVGPTYGITGKRILYVGRDTRGWEPNLGKLLRLYETDRETTVRQVVSSASQCLERLDHVTWKTQRARFWDFVFAFHLAANRVKAGKTPTPDILRNDLREWSQSIAWANVHPIERTESLDERGVAFSAKAHGVVDSRSGFLQSLQTLLEVTDPDVMLILYGGMNYKVTLAEFPGYTFDKFSERTWEIKLPGIRTRVFWTDHPRRMSLHGGPKPYLDAILGRLA